MLFICTIFESICRLDVNVSSALLPTSVLLLSINMMCAKETHCATQYSRKNCVGRCKHTIALMAVIAPLHIPACFAVNLWLHFCSSVNEGKLPELSSVCSFDLYPNSAAQATVYEISKLPVRNRLHRNVSGIPLTMLGAQGWSQAKMV